MSLKAKDLQYDPNEPSFLRKLKSQYGGGDGRYARPAARPRKHALEVDDDDDQPTYVVEDSKEVLSKAEYEALSTDVGANAESKRESATSGPACKSQEKTKTNGAAPVESERPLTKQDAAAIGIMNKKRKVVRLGRDDKDTSEPPHRTQAKKRPKVHLSFDQT